MQLHHMPNLNRPRLCEAKQLTEAELDAAIARQPRPKPQPLPPMDFQPHQAAHAASEIDDDLPTTASDRRIRAVLAWAYVAAICAVGYLAIFH